MIDDAHRLARKITTDKCATNKLKKGLLQLTCDPSSSLVYRIVPPESVSPLF
jgi:hypothetical protein